jgi:hypothetical protein
MSVRIHNFRHDSDSEQAISTICKMLLKECVNQRQLILYHHFTTMYSIGKVLTVMLYNKVIWPVLEPCII